MRVAAATLRTTPLDFEGNRTRVSRLLAEARAADVDIVVFPELCLSGYECGDFFWHPWVAESSWESLQLLLPETEGLIAVVGLPLLLGNRLYNSAAVIGEGQIWGFSLKRNLPNEGLFYEPRWFTPAPEGRMVEPRSGSPAGYGLPFVWENLHLLIEICEDAWRPGRPLERHFAHIALALNASPYEMHKAARRYRLVSESSYRYHCVYAYANLLGNEAGKVLYEGECLIAWEGEILAATPRFSYQDGDLTWVEIPEEGLMRAARKNTAPAHEAPVKISVPRKKRHSLLPTTKQRFRPVENLWEDLTEAVAMGLWDYMWKSRSRGFVISLSGGLDSGACAVLAYLALTWAKERLSSDLYRSRLQYMPEGMIPQVYAFYQATAQSSVDTFNRAQTLAQQMGIPFFRWDVQPLVEAYEKQVEAWLGRSLSWERDDIARQNLQARVRVPGVWMAANLLGALLITTSNRSELAVGYSTMDGDSAGGIAPIAGIAKSDLRAWGLWAADHFGWDALREIALAVPTAELRPGDQSDEEDLMPYPLLNALETLLVREGRSSAALRAFVAGQNLPPEWVEKFLYLFRISQWKRERTAPSFHLDGHDLDPRSAARFPILHAFA
ncbi:MAG: NAD(+) synthase [Bacteroidia bacterium]|nr:NAD(+) synthase [Bacteroidia bacterium]